MEVGADWYHGDIPRGEAEARLVDAGSVPWSFLVRRKGGGEYALSRVRSGGSIVRHLVQVGVDQQCRVDGTPALEGVRNIAEAVDHLRARPGRMVGRLGTVVAVKDCV